MLPAYSWHTKLNEDSLVMQMLAQHALIRARMDQMETLLSSKQPVGAEVIALGALLQEHVRLEEDQLFPRMEAALSEEELLALSQRFTRLHEEQEQP